MMRPKIQENLCGLLFILMMVLCSGATAQKILNIRDFGAKGDGRTDDSRAFLKASEMINAIRNNVTLVIPKGTYLVRPQEPTPAYDKAPYRDLELLHLKNCSNIVIQGQPGAVIRHATGLYFGAFRRKPGGGFEAYPERTTIWEYRVAIGHGIHLQDCRKVTVRDIELDGNNGGFNIGGEFGDVGLQIDHDGVFLQNSVDVSLFNLNVHNFGRDGLQIINRTPQGFKSPNQNLKLVNCRFERNSRQGFSWTGGVGLTAANCTFSNTGRDKLSSPPGAGIDFEPNYSYVVADGKFVNCTILNNAGVAVLSDMGGRNVTNILFSHCRMVGQVGPAVWIKSPAFTFADCYIDGAFFFGFDAEKAADGTRFLRCTFTDSASADAYTKYLVESNGSRFLLFDQCVFKGGSKGFLYINAAAQSAADRAVLRNCTFINAFDKPPVYGTFSTRVDFSGKTVFLSKGKEQLSWNIEGSRFVGTAKAPADIEIRSKHLLGSYDTVYVGTASGRDRLSVSENGLLSMNTNSRLVVDAGGTLHLKKGGSLWLAPGAELIIKGKLIADEGSFLCIHHGAKLSAESRGRIQVNGKVLNTDNPKMNYGLSGCITITQ